MKITHDLIFGLAGSVLSSRFDEAKRTPECHKEWWALCTSEHPFVAIAAPRGHAKSTSITHCYSLACLLFQDRRFELIVSDTWQQAVMFLRDIYTELTENEALIDMFNDGQPFTFVKDAEDDIIVVGKNGHKFRVMARGAEQKIRGLKWDGMRPDLIVCDDLENDEIVLNSERREKFKKWFTGALVPCRSDRGIIRVVGTILHMDSLLENLMPKRQDRTYTREDDLKLFSIKKVTPKSGWVSVKYKAHNSDLSMILWPEKWPKDKLIAERQKYIDIGNPEGYSQEYLNEPIDESRAYFRRGDLLPMDETARKLPKRMYAAVDFAISELERRDFTAIVIGGMDEYGILHIVDVIKERMDAYAIIDNMIAVQNKYHPDVFTVEAGAIEKALGPFLKAEMFKRGGEFLNLLPLVPTKDKESRARSMQARVRSGGVRFDKDTDWWPDFEQEVLTFPRGVHNDQVDALAWLGLTLDRMLTGPTVQDLEEEFYDEKLQQHDSRDEGRNSVTGY